MFEPKKDNKKSVLSETDKNLMDEKAALLNEIKQTYSGVSNSTNNSIGSAADNDLDNSIGNGSDNGADQDIKTDGIIGTETIENDADGPESSDETGYNDPIIVKTGEPLPKFGPGFIFVPIVIALTVLAIVLGHIHPISMGIPKAAWVRYVYIGFGILIAVCGIKLIVDAISGSAINENLAMGKLVTTGIYSKTRNPIYGGLLFLCSGCILISGNAFMYVLPIAYWIFLSKLMENTEEVLLTERFGDEYVKYMNETYRILPFNK